MDGNAAPSGSMPQPWNQARSRAACRAPCSTTSRCEAARNARDPSTAEARSSASTAAATALRWACTGLAGTGPGATTTSPDSAARTSSAAPAVAGPPSAAASRAAASAVISVRHNAS
jgi:hypothetical protein